LGSAEKARRKLGWSHKVSFRELVREMVREDVRLTEGQGGGQGPAA
jgi:GDPmannose 4,6-dehydratase